MPTTWRSRLILAAAVLAAIAIVVLAMRALTGGDTAAPSESPSPTASPTPEPPPKLKPFKVKLTAANDQPMDNGNMFGRKGDERPKVVKVAARNGVKLLERYLNAAFVHPKTRLTAKALDTLLTKRAREELGKGDRRALGVGAPKIGGGRRQRAEARVLVVHDGPRVSAMTVRYRMAMKVVTSAGRTSSLRQRGILVLLRTPKGWRADLIDVRFTPPKAGKPEPKEEPTGASETPSPAEESTS